MGGGACQRIIIEGQLAYAVTEAALDKFTNLNTILLEAAINASCNGIQFAGIYNEIRDEGYIPTDITGAIIATHKRIIEEVLIADKKSVQQLVDELADKLFAVTRKLYEESPDFIPTDLDSVRRQMKGQ